MLRNVKKVCSLVSKKSYYTVNYLLSCVMKFTPATFKIKTSSINYLYFSAQFDRFDRF